MRNPLLAVFCFGFSVYLFQTIGNEWFETLFSYPLMRNFITIFLFFFEAILYVLLITTLFICLSRVFLTKESRSRCLAHGTAIVTSMLLLAFFTLLVSVLFFSRKEEPNKEIILDEVQRMDLEETLSSPQEETVLGSTLLGAKQTGIIDVFAKNNRRLWLHKRFELLFLSCFILVLSLGYASVLATSRKGAHTLTKGYLIMAVQDLRFAVIKVVDSMLAFAPLGLFLVVPYLLRFFHNKAISSFVSSFVLVFYGYGVVLIVLNLIVCYVVHKEKKLRTLTKAILYPSGIAFFTGRSISALYRLVLHSISDLKIKRETVKDYMPLYLIFARFGHVVYVIYAIFFLSRFSVLALTAFDFIFLSLFAILFTFCTFATQGSAFIYILSMFLYLFGIPLEPALVVLLGSDLLFAPMRSAITIHCTITLISIFNKKHEKDITRT